VRWYIVIRNAFKSQNSIFGGNMRRSILVLSISIILADSFLLFPGELKNLSFEQVYLNQGEQLFNPLPQIVEWADNTHYYEMKGYQLFKVDARNGKSKLVLDGSQYLMFIQEGFNPAKADDKTADYSRFLFENKGDIYLFDTTEKEKDRMIRQLTQTDGTEHNPTFSPDNTKIAYTRNGNLYIYDLDQKKEIRLTDDGSENILNGRASWVYMEEILGRRTNYKAFWWSPDSRKIAFIRFDQSRVPVFPIFRASGTYGELENQRYPKPDFPNPEVKTGIVNLADRSIRWLPVEDHNDHYIAFPMWNKKSSALYLQWMNRDQNHLKILRYDLNSKVLKTVYEEKQKTWIDFFEDGDLHLLANEDLLVRSSISGWFHIYHVSQNGSTRPVTSGEWSVDSIDAIDQQKQLIFFTARKEDSTETDFYRVDFNGKQLKRLTVDKGSHRAEVSPNGAYFVDEYSSVSFPARMELRNADGKLIRKLGDSYCTVMDTYRLAKKELFRVKTEDGYELPVVWLLPPDFDKNKKYPAIFNIYGGPGASTVRNAFVFRGRLNDHYLAQQGIIILSADHRGSGHFGKKGMDLMYRNLGKWEMADYIEIVKYLRTLPFVDSERIGITGGSYGGYVTALALTFGSDYFKFGIAGSSVIDWSLYDSVYTERYMDTPQDNAEGYRNSSVLNYIDKYKSGTLLITHGTMDDNVHMQNTIQFIDKVLEAGKLVELMLFPGERHGFRRLRTSNYKIELDFWSRKFFPAERGSNK
jgi:dipeptidyl-peptidase-4